MSKVQTHLVEEPFCEHCGRGFWAYEITDENGTKWCAVCAGEDGVISRKKAHWLSTKETEIRKVIKETVTAWVQKRILR